MQSVRLPVLSIGWYARQDSNCDLPLRRRCGPVPDLGPHSVLGQISVRILNSSGPLPVVIEFDTGQRDEPNAGVTRVGLPRVGVVQVDPIRDILERITPTGPVKPETGQALGHVCCPIDYVSSGRRDALVHAGNVRVAAGCGTLSVRYALQCIDGKLCLVEPKTKRSRRTLPLPASVAALRAHRDRQAFEQGKAGASWAETGLVFTTAKGTAIDARNAVRHFKAVLDQAGLPNVGWHDMRHTAASLPLAQGVGPRTVMEVLGHSQISLTMDTYSHVMPELIRQAADLMDRLLTASG